MSEPLMLSYWDKLTTEQMNKLLQDLNDENLTSISLNQLAFMPAMELMARLHITHKNSLCGCVTCKILKETGIAELLPGAA